jgi:hypothetical protein
MWAYFWQTSHAQDPAARLRARQQGETVPLAAQRRIYLERLAEVHALLAA